MPERPGELGKDGPELGLGLLKAPRVREIGLEDDNNNNNNNNNETFITRLLTRNS